jgi:hypothetical protein
LSKAIPKNIKIYQALKDHFFNGVPDANGITRQVPKNDIVFMKEGSFGNTLTPWMILHTFAHSIFDVTFISSIGIDRSKILSKVRDASNIALQLGDIYNRGILNLKDLYLIFPMGSLRKYNKGVEKYPHIDDPSVFSDLDNEELFREMFVYYLTKGGTIPLKPDVQKLPNPEKIAKLVYDLSKSFRAILEACRGEVMFDYRGQSKYQN